MATLAAMTAVRFSSDVYGRRLHAAGAAAARAGVAGLIVTPGYDLRYLIGSRAQTFERLTALVIPSTGDPVIVIPRLELASLVRPALTTVTMPLEELGRRAVDRLAEQITGSGPAGSAPTAADPVLAVTLTVRGSTAPYAAGRT